MTIRPEYSKYSKRLFRGLGSVIFLTFFWTILLLMNDIGKLGLILIIGVFGMISLFLIISVFTKSKTYLTEIKFDGENWVFEIFEFDKQKEIIKLNISETRIKIWEIFFPFTKFGRNYKLIIETKQGLIYKRIIQQYEIGNWNLSKFKEVIKLYGEIKDVKTSTASYARDNFSTNND